MSRRQQSARKNQQQQLSQPSVGGDSLVATKPSKLFATKQYGTQGRAVKLKVNFFKISLAKCPDIYHYNIEIIPERLAQPGELAACAKPAQSGTPSAAVSSVVSANPPAASEPKQSGKPKGKGRKAAAAKAAGIDLPVKSTPAASSSGASASSPAASASTPAASTSQPIPDSKSKTPRSKRVPKELHNVIFRAIFTSYPVFKCEGILPFFDGEKNFYSFTKFHLPNNCWSGLIIVGNGDAEEKYLVNITVPETSHCQNFAKLREKDGRLMPYELQALDILLRNGPRLTKVALGPNLFFKFNDPLGQNLRYLIGGRFPDPLKYIQFGSYQSTRRTDDGLFYNVDRAMAVFTKGGDLIGIIDQIVPGASKVNRELQPDQRKRIGDAINGLKFSVKHLNYRTFTVSGLSNQTVQNQVIDIEEDGAKMQTTVLEYFKKKYPEFIRRFPPNLFLPCVKYGPRKRPNYCPIECVQLLSDEVYRPKLKPDQQGEVTRASSQQKPLERFQSIQRQISTLQQDNTIEFQGQKVDYLKHLGVSVASEPTVVDARILDAPKLAYGKNAAVDPRNGQWDMTKFEFYRASSEPVGVNWAVINFHKLFGQENRNTIRKEMVDKLTKALVAGARDKGMRQLSCPKTTWYDFDYRGKGTLERDIFNKLDKDVRFAVFLFPKDKNDIGKNDIGKTIYSEIKAQAELSKFRRGLATQCLCQEQKYWKDDRLFPQFITNILLKINPKLRGTNVSITQGRPAIMKDKKTMFMGLDVTHPSPVGDLKHSIAAVVATYTDDFDKVFAKTRIQEKGRKELINLQEIMRELLSLYQKVNGCYPDKVVVYRDGVGEGDFEKMIERELGDLRKASQELKAGIKFTYIMVQKRHNTRFIPVVIQNERFQNIQPGTCVDRQITHSALFEFYLCSHAGMMGTSRPAKYVVLVDDNRLSADEIQKATYWFCHLYPRCTKTASIPPTVWFAHLLAERTRYYLAHFDNSDGRSSVGSGGSQLEVLSENQRREIEENITIHDRLNGTLHFI